MWSKSVWVSQIQRRSADIDHRPQRRQELVAPRDVPVSTRTGSVPCNTKALIGERAERGDVGGRR